MKNSIIKHFNSTCIIYVAGMFLLPSIASADENNATPAMPAMPSPTVAASVASNVAYNPTRNYTGRLTSKESVSVVAQVTGKITEIAFKEGAMITAGDLLYKLDDVRYRAQVLAMRANIDAAKAQVKQIESSLSYSQKTFERTKTLFEKNVASQDDFDNASSQNAMLSASLEAAKATLSSAEAQLVGLEKDLSHCTITAPISGKVGLNRFSKGNTVSTSSGVLTTIVMKDPLRLVFSMANGDLLKYYKSEENLKKNFVIKIRLGDGSLYDKIGDVDFIDNAAEVTTDSITIYAVIPNPEGRLMAGSTVSVEVSARADEIKTVVPLTSVSYDKAGAYVWVLNEGDVPEKRPIIPLVATKDNIIVSDGVSVGERVVAAGTHKIIPGVKVNIVPAEGMGPEAPAVVRSSDVL